MTKNNFDITGKTKKVGIIGWPVEHSLSPVFQNAAIKHHNLDAVYVPLACKPENIQSAINGLRHLDFIGANVTVPHKEAVISYLDRVDPVAKFLGSVNTIYWEDDKLCGTSTDPYGAFKNLYAHGHTLENQDVVMLGNGGAARALAFTLCAEYGNKINSLTILGRSIEKVEVLCQEINEKSESQIMVKAGVINDFKSISPSVTIIINATTVGMSPNVEQTPIDTSHLRAGQIVYDIVYTPLMTRLLQDAKAMRCQIVTGIGMLVHQGALSFEKWFKISPDINVINNALNKYNNSE